mgnify:FL=1
MKKEKPYLLEFYGKDCPHCERMREMTLELEEEGLVFERLETWESVKNDALMHELSHGKCDGVPYFYNKKTGKSICGETTYKKLKAWATEHDKT